MLTADAIVELGGAIEATTYGFTISTPTRFGEGEGTHLSGLQRVVEAAEVLDRARELVHARLVEGRPLPDEQPPVGGGGAVTT